MPVKYKGSSGSGSGVNDIIQIHSNLDVVESDGTWIRSGVLETDVSKFPDATKGEMGRLDDTIDLSTQQPNIGLAYNSYIGRYYIGKRQTSDWYRAYYYTLSGYGSYVRMNTADYNGMVDLGTVNGQLVGLDGNYTLVNTQGNGTHLSLNHTFGASSSYVKFCHNQIKNTYYFVDIVSSDYRIREFDSNGNLISTSVDLGHSSSSNNSIKSISFDADSGKLYLLRRNNILVLNNDLTIFDEAVTFVDDTDPNFSFGNFRSICFEENTGIMATTYYDNDTIFDVRRYALDYVGVTRSTNPDTGARYYVRVK